ncbi:hypothetical protein [Entomobacter blattae]|uniref:Uncharacterized protein n=1 Tax=Entomobacter blattae TaxID=2762277 RepID=A0A7H1NU11_9PROT|nr:hypothetical protein [Entomobacter blattae]QNT79271.1 hypothetical protein JGUZn3_20660 [Entomobacter blattae]
MGSVARDYSIKSYKNTAREQCAYFDDDLLVSVFMQNCNADLKKKYKSIAGGVRAQRRIFRQEILRRMKEGRDDQ